MPTRRKPNETLVRPVHPNAGLEAEYRRKLQCLVDEMHKSVAHWVTAAYRANEPAIAQDATPAVTLQATMRELVERWQSRFDDASKDLAEYFGTSVSRRTDDALKAILKRSGFTVRFRMTAAARDVMKATINAQVSLIKSIPQKYLTDVEGMVMRSVQTGRDLAALSKELQDAYGVTKRRAATIALDQNNKATSAMQRARQTELGITEAVWMHSGGGKHPRPAHVAANGKRYDVAKGMFIDGEWIFPGEKINCRCVSRSVVVGFA